ncbi:MAG: NusG domain II-containing protein [Candidatus Aminicenantes bacterium]|nr:NusG domain II-containing protein [Candidatus Aminicenantes bacterium]
MDRRNFLKKMVYTPIFTPLLLSQSSKQDHLELFVISESPASVLGVLLKEIKKYVLVSGTDYFLSPSHPQKKLLKNGLSRFGWKESSSTQKANLFLNYQILEKDSLPSFTLVRNGKVQDIRSREFYSIWKNMYRYQPASRLVTSACLKNTGLLPGSSATVSISGKTIEIFSLDKKRLLTYTTPTGKVTIAVENGKVRVLDSDCQNKICTYTAPISLSGERIICAPNHFFVEINGETPIDTIIG